MSLPTFLASAVPVRKEGKNWNVSDGRTRKGAKTNENVISRKKAQKAQTRKSSSYFCAFCAFLRLMTLIEKNVQVTPEISFVK